MDKKIKDPIYGYVKIPVEYMEEIIDKAEFQRLRRILQTSYSPLYSSAIHNRFVHSIGVFHLGSIAAETLRKEMNAKDLLSCDVAEQMIRVYRLACLLHDVGHAPFSHTGECFYKNETFQSVELHDRIGELVGDREFTAELLKMEANAAAPHELMSVIIGLKVFGKSIGSRRDKEFFARCITGYLYTDGTKDNQIRNCFITMLNSKVIDVDRLDYLIRDAYITGFATINIDYQRLLKALTIVEYKGKYQIAYKKDAVSIIENVVYAHDAEKKWIQNHPVVLYEAYIIKHIIVHLNNKLNEDGKRLFSEAALSREGVELQDGIKVSLLCDDDIIYLYKNVYPDELSRELLDREKRRHPVWKSEAEYMGYISELSKGEFKTMFDDCISALAAGKTKDIPSFIRITPEYIQSLKQELERVKSLTTLDKEKNRSIEQNYKGIQRKLAVCNFLKKSARDNKIDCDFVILKADMFTSSFSKQELANTLLVFKDNEAEDIFELNKVSSLLRSDTTKDNMFYIFYRRKNHNNIKDKKEFCKSLVVKTIDT